MKKDTEAQNNLTQAPADKKTSAEKKAPVKRKPKETAAGAKRTQKKTAKPKAAAQTAAEKTEEAKAAVKETAAKPRRAKKPASGENAGTGEVKTTAVKETAAKPRRAKKPASGEGAGTGEVKTTAVKETAAKPRRAKKTASGEGAGTGEVKTTAVKETAAKPRRAKKPTSGENVGVGETKKTAAKKPAVKSRRAKKAVTEQVTKKTEKPNSLFENPAEPAQGAAGAASADVLSPADAEAAAAQAADTSTEKAEPAKSVSRAEARQQKKKARHVAAPVVPPLPVVEQPPEIAATAHQRYYKDLCFMTIPLLCMAYYFYGLRPVLMCAVALVTGNLCDRIVARLRKREYRNADYSNESFAMLIALMLPATVSWYVLIAAVLAGVLIGKEAFGGYGSYPFHPSAVGYVVAAVSWPSQVFRYPMPFTPIPLLNVSGVAVQNGISNTLKNGGVPGVDLMDQLLGNYAGPIGTTAILVILAMALFLLVRRDINIYTPLAFMAVVAAIAFLFPRQGGLEGTSVLGTIPARLNMMRYEMLSGAMLFGAVFLMCEPFTSPRRHRSGKILYGAVLGVTAMAFRYFGAYDTGLCFALLAVNGISEWLDILVEHLHVLTHGGSIRKGGASNEG